MFLLEILLKCGSISGNPFLLASAKFFILFHFPPWFFHMQRGEFYRNFAGTKTLVCFHSSCTLRRFIICPFYQPKENHAGSWKVLVLTKWNHLICHLNGYLLTWCLENPVSAVGLHRFWSPERKISTHYKMSSMAWGLIPFRRTRRLFNFYSQKMLGITHPKQEPKCYRFLSD